MDYRNGESSPEMVVIEGLYKQFPIIDPDNWMHGLITFKELEYQSTTKCVFFVFARNDIQIAFIDILELQWG